jgi:glycine oxidase
MARPDITVMGAGIFGLSIAWILSQRGARVRVIEKRALGAGASGGPLGALAPHVPELWNAKKTFQLQSLLMSAKFWAEVEESSGHKTGYARTGRLLPLAHAHAVAQARARMEMAQDIWQEHALWQVIDRPMVQWSPPSPSGLVVYENLTARIQPLAALQSLVKAVVAIGGEVIFGASLAHGSDAGPVIWATGYEGLLEMGDALGQSVGVGEKGQAMLLDFVAPQNAPQLFVDGVHFVPHENGTLAIGSTRERYWDNPDQTDAQLEYLYQKTLGIFPFLRDTKVLTRWACLRPRSNTRAPILGEWPGRP